MPLCFGFPEKNVPKETGFPRDSIVRKTMRPPQITAKASLPKGYVLDVFTITKIKGNVNDLFSFCSSKNYKTIILCVSSGLIDKNRRCLARRMIGAC